MSTHLGPFKFLLPTSCPAISFTGLTYTTNFYDLDADSNIDEIFGIFISPDGSNIYMVQRPSAVAIDYKIFQYSITGGDISTMLYVNELDIETDFFINGFQEPPEYITFSHDGLKMYVNQTFYLVGYTLSTAWDITTATKDYHTAYSDWNGDLVDRAAHIVINSTGSKGMLVDIDDNHLVSFTLSTAFDFRSLYADDFVNYLTVIDSEIGALFTCDGSAILSIGIKINITKSEIATPYDVTTISFLSEYLYNFVPLDFDRVILYSNLVNNNLYIFGTDNAADPKGYTIKQYSLT